jgi:hypothetical protein
VRVVLIVELFPAVLSVRVLDPVVEQYTLNVVDPVEVVSVKVPTRQLVLSLSVIVALWI